jgi:hypothetical protein
MVAGVDTIYRANGLEGLQLAYLRVYTNPATDPFVSSTTKDTFLQVLGNVKYEIHDFPWDAIGIAITNSTCLTSGGHGVTTFWWAVPHTLALTTLAMAHVIIKNLDKTNLCRRSGTILELLMMLLILLILWHQLLDQQQFCNLLHSASLFSARRANGGYNCFIGKYFLNKLMLH